MTIKLIGGYIYISILSIFRKSCSYKYYLIPFRQIMHKIRLVLITLYKANLPLIFPTYNINIYSFYHLLLATFPLLINAIKSIIMLQHES